MRGFKSYLLRQMLASLRLGVRTICRFVVIKVCRVAYNVCVPKKTVEYGVVYSVNKDLPVRGIAVCLEKWLISSDIGRSVYATHGKVALGLCPSQPQWTHSLLQGKNVRHSRQ